MKRVGFVVLFGLVVAGTLSGAPGVRAAAPSPALYASMHGRWVATRDVNLFSLVRFTHVLRHANWAQPSVVLTIRPAHADPPLLYRLPMHRAVLPGGISRFMVTFRLNRIQAANRLRAIFQATGRAGQRTTASLNFTVHFPAPGASGT